MEDEVGRYLVIVQLRADSAPDRIRRDVPLILEWVQHFSRGEQEAAFRSNDGLLFGFFIKANAPQFLQPEFEKCRGTINGDSMLAFKAGPLAGGVGFSRAWTWLQHH